MVGWRRVAAGVGLALCGLLLAGCRVTGTVDVPSADALTFDLLLVGEDAPCDPERNSPRFTYQRTTDDSGAAACRVGGTLTPSDLANFHFALTDVGEYRILALDLGGDRTDWPEGDVTFRFPGDVMQTSQGTPSGNTVRVTDLPGLSGGIQVVALNRPGPERWVVSAVAGVAVGAGLALLAVRGVRLLRRRTDASEAEPVDLVPSGAVVTAWTPPADPATGDDPPAAGVDAAWAAPPEPAPADADHSMWAPPEDREPGPVD